MSTQETARNLVLTRTFNAPRSLVFKAWTDPERLVQWWGPEGFTNPRCEADARPGGAIRIDMRGPDGTVYPMTGTFQEIVEPERIVFTSGALDMAGELLFEILTTVTFEEQGQDTRLTLEARVVSFTAAGTHNLDGMEIGWTQSLERLDVHVLAPLEIAATRVFDAPRARVFKMWTDPEHIAHWWGPTGFTTTIHEMEVKPGGVWRLIMHSPDGQDFPNKIIYREVVEPELLIYDHVTGPLFHVTVRFSDFGDKTLVNYRMRFESPERRDKVATEFGAVEGLSETLARLAELLAVK